MDFSRILSHLMQIHNTTDSELADYVGVSRQAIAKWRNGASPSFDKVIKVADFYNLQLEDLGISVSKAPKEKHSVPIVGSIQAGYPVQSFDVSQGYVTTDLQSDSLYALKVIGDSMMPIVMEGDIIICDKMHGNPNGKICVVTVDGESTLKKVKKDSTGITLVPTNPMYREMHYSPKQCEEKDLRIDGVLVEMIRKF